MLAKSILKEIFKKYENILEKMKQIYYNITVSLIFAGMAQLVEQRIRNAQVVGSSPTTSSKRHLWVSFFMYDGHINALW